MKTIVTLVGLFLLGTSLSYAQQSAPKTNNDINTNKSVIAGHFDVDKKNEQRGITEHINVNYVLSPVPFTRSLTVQLRTADPLMFTADVVDHNGNKLSHWMPKAKSYTYNESIDISQLPAGDYKLNIYSEFNKAVAYSVSFQKQ